MTELAQVHVESLGSLVLTRVKGEVDLSNAALIRERVLTAVPNTAAGLVLDLTETYHLDSSGVRLVFELANRLGNRGQTLELVAPDDSVARRVLDLTEANQVVPMHTSVDAALS
jgi:stage II sporulation protein AA (anti-sigma F factor antagonist)